LEAEKDYRAVAELTRGAFGNVYKPGADGHYYVHIMQFHPGFIPDLAFVLEKDGRIIGNIICTKVWQEDKTAGGEKETLFFGPHVLHRSISGRNRTGSSSSIPLMWRGRWGMM
jgi:predicted N-acetyltransferase YhbS